MTSLNFDYYLQDLPQELNQYGLNKTLITRALTIDWKHRDTEIHLRNPILLDKVALDFDLKELYKTRSNQLRFIYNIPRKTLKNEDLNSLVYVFDFLKQNHFNTELGNIFIDINCIVRKDSVLDKQLIENSVVFSYKFMKQQDMIKYFISRDLPIPKLFIAVSSLEELNSLFKKNISFILIDKHTFSDLETLYLWLCNYHLYIPYFKHNNSTYSRVSYKTDTVLDSAYTYM